MSKLMMLGYALALSAGCHGRVRAPASPAGGSELTLEVIPTLSGSRCAVLRTGDEVASGDGIHVAVKPTIDAHVYVAYCDRNHRLTIFPSDGGLAAPAGKLTRVPPNDGLIILDEEVGLEVLYVIASRRPLDVADPELAAALSRARPDTAAECGQPLDQVIQRDKQSLIEAGSPEEPELRADRSAATAEPSSAAAAAEPPGAAAERPSVAAIAEPPGSAGAAKAPGSAATAKPSGPAATAKPSGPAAAAEPPSSTTASAVPPRPAVPSAIRPHSASPRRRVQSRIPLPVTLERGAFIRWGAEGNVAAGGDRRDIVVLRYGFTHVARRAP